MSLRVMHITVGLELGGAETLLFRLIERQSDVQHEIVALLGRDWYSSIFEQRGVPVTHLGISSAASIPSGLIRLYTAIRRSRPDVVQGWMYAANVLGGIAARMARVPMVWSIHTASLDPVRGASRTFARVGGRLASALPAFVIYCSKAAADCHEALGYAAACGAVIDNGYDAEVFFPDEAKRSEMRRTLQIAPDELVIGSMSRWIGYKDVPTLLAALRIARKQGVTGTCLLLGNGLDADNPELQQSIDENGCGGFVRPMGMRSDIADIARVLDLHVLPSRTESFGNTIAETMLAGIPNVVTDCGGPPDVVGDTGWVVPVGDPERLAAAILEAWEERTKQPEHWKQRRAAARARIAENFSFGRMAEAYEQVWKRFAVQRTRATPVPPRDRGDHAE